MYISSLFLITKKKSVKVTSGKCFGPIYTSQSLLLGIILLGIIKPWWFLMQVLSLLEVFYNSLGSVLILLHTSGVWLLQRPPIQALLAWQCRPDCILYRYRPPFLHCLPRRSHLQNGLQSHFHCSKIYEVRISLRGDWLPPVGCYL